LLRGPEMSSIPTAPRWDILGIGCVAVDDLLYVEAYPAPDAKMHSRFAEASVRPGLPPPGDSGCPTASAAGWPAADATTSGFSRGWRPVAGRSAGTGWNSWYQSCLPREDPRVVAAAAAALPGFPPRILLRA